MFVENELPISITPEYPAICNPEIGVTVTCAQEYDYYIWKHVASNTVMAEGDDKQSVQIKKFGNPAISPVGQWELIIQTSVNGVACFQTFEFIVDDISNADGIIQYFNHAGFYPIDIWRDVLPQIRDENSGNRGSTCDISEIK